VRIWRLIVTSPTLIVVGLTGLSISALWAAESRLVRTAQMWGSELAEEKVTATVGIAGECTRRSDGTLICQFASISASDDGQCIVSTWSERLHLVHKTPDLVTWGGTRGPEGLAGMMTATTVTAGRAPTANSKTDHFSTIGPTAFDKWSYKSTASFSAPSLGGKPLPTTTTDLRSGLPPSLRCKNTTVIASSPGS
jgi:hypothetical protein